MANRYFADISNNNPGGKNFWAYRHLGQHVLVGLKVTEGTGFVDRYHAGWSEQAHKAGCWVIHYHFAHPSGSASAQAGHFYQNVHGHLARLDFPCLDIEVTDGQSMRDVSGWCNAFAAEFKRLSGHSLVGYSSQSFRDELHTDIARWWTAAYGPREPFRSWAWQFTDGSEGPSPHSCIGIGRSDVSRLNPATYDRLRRVSP